MADKTSLIINAVNDNGDKVSKAITSINPDASPMALKNFAQKLSGLTNDTFTDATRVEQVNVTGAKKVTPTIFVSAGGCIEALGQSYYSLELSYPGPARAVKLSGGLPKWYDVTRDGKKLIFKMNGYRVDGTVPDPSYTIPTDITLPENDYYNAASVKFLWSGITSYDDCVEIDKEV